jgi:catechol 2,3-dioxygenase-like lactoylglutathione lyase family enzyme
MVTRRCIMSTENVVKGRITGVDHIAIPVNDIEAAERFYVGVLGAEVLMRVTREFMAQVMPWRPDHDTDRGLHTSIRFGDGPRIDLFLQGHGQPRPEQDHPHLAFAVRPEDLLELKAALNARGVPTDGPRRLGPPGQASLYFNDPFGNHLELACMGFTGEVTLGPPDNASYAYTRKEK